MPQQVRSTTCVRGQKLLFSCTEDLWAHLAEASGKPVATVMSTWTQQMGYPVLSVEGKQVKSSSLWALLLF